MTTQEQLEKIILSFFKNQQLGSSVGCKALASAIHSAMRIDGELQKLLIEADSTLSYIRHRCEVSKMGNLTYAELDSLIGRLRTKQESIIKNAQEIIKFEEE